MSESKFIVWQSTHQLSNQADYYRSDAWREERVKALEEVGHKCQRCGLVLDILHVHHVNGINDDTLEVLCPMCHFKEHKKEEILKTVACTGCSTPLVWIDKKPYEYVGEEIIRHFCQWYQTHCRYCKQEIFWKDGRIYLKDSKKSHMNCPIGRRSKY